METIRLTCPDPAGQVEKFEIIANVWRHPRAKRTVLVYPPTGGLTILDRHLIKNLRHNNLNIIALKWFTGAWERTPDWNVHERGLVRGRECGLRLLEWAKENWDNDSFAVIGSSMGAFFAASLAAKREDIHKLVIIAGGCPVSEIVSRTWFFPLLKIRGWRKRHYAVTNEKDYRRRLEQAVKTEPGKRLTPRPTRDDLMIVGSRDWIMPTRNQFRLAQQLRNPKIIKVSGGHFKTIVYANTFLVSRIVEHVEDGSMINLSTKTASAAPATISST